MDRDAAFAIGSVLCELLELMDRKGLCASHEFAEALGAAAINAEHADAPFPSHARYLGMWAYMAREAVEGRGR